MFVDIYHEFEALSLQMTNEIFKKQNWITNLSLHENSNTYQRFFHSIYIFLYCNTETGFKSSANESMTKENAIHKQKLKKKLIAQLYLQELKIGRFLSIVLLQSNLTKKMFTRLTTTNSAYILLKWISLKLYDRNFFMFFMMCSNLNYWWQLIDYYIIKKRDEFRWKLIVKRKWFNSGRCSMHTMKFLVPMFEQVRLRLN